MHKKNTYTPSATMLSSCNTLISTQEEEKNYDMRAYDPFFMLT
jgi:hypothetical protein